METGVDNSTAMAIFGFEFDPNDPAVILEYSFVNVLITSISTPLVRLVCGKPRESTKPCLATT